MKVLVTGGSGFVGTATIHALHTAHPDWTIYNLDLRPPSSPTSPSSPSSPSTFLKADITSLPALSTLLSSLPPLDSIIHTAGLIPSGTSRYRPSPSTLSRVHQVNITGTRNILTAARSARVKSLVYTSSCTVITDDLEHDYPLMRESLLPSGCATLPYGASKAAAEKLVLDADGAEMATCALRPATVIGEGDSYGVVRTIAGLTRAERAFCIGEGDNLFDFVEVRNVAGAVVGAVENLLGILGGGGGDAGDAERDEGEGGGKEGRRSARGKAIFVSNGQPVYFRDFMKAVWARCDGHVPWDVKVPEGLAWWLGLVSETMGWVMGREVALSRGSVMDAVGTRYADITRARELLRYDPKIGMAEAVRVACDDYLRQRREEEMWKAEKKEK
ncbi:sterol-4-alpha-carboxylate 3-dehydrogenase-like protein [Elsinoe australis]|uniref:Sterol-4-alpha-carboxylate 3-dehydrogenase-like protein n=1 Tax=Elsinoe australis TaxID=40998 RepID=A0A4U7BDX6_9PEZI|nr:sterol-4-alpha-carboxylate 3-dehydrogenase-like protein [Elsinoe australis]